MNERAYGSANGQRTHAGENMDADSLPEEDEQPKIRPVPIGQFLIDHPAQRAIVIDGLLRRGETMNVISASKVGKSWLLMLLAFAVATGARWLGFPTTIGRVLIIDNELHPETLAWRLQKLREKCGPFAIEPEIDVLSLRGRLKDLRAIGYLLEDIEPGYYSLIIIDAWYRTLPIGTDENANADIAGLYNLLDTYADRLGCSFALVHHSSKGNQSEKAITDVGSGAGAQSRAADTHLVLRPHQEESVVVLDAVVRSFPPVPSRCLKFTWPLFTPTQEFDPKDLKPAANSRKKKPTETTPKPTKPEPWTSQRFVDAFVTDEPKLKSIIIDDAMAQGLAQRLPETLLKAAIDRGIAFSDEGAQSARKVRIAKVPFTAEKPRRKRHRKAK